ncbi:hypothetical protein FVE85_5753 [Porphyridium purpureum]|uniref:Uncharacterized protein n=1 Tax=Porphyridium purpureum TaxID=35688 RepID=A0A5J4Z4M1_PORPP|nr:hypothetical protein FVE85_5753 [Porphyridium purpureum]|eukprot:POR0898..scf295_1
MWPCMCARGRRMETRSAGAIASHELVAFGTCAGALDMRQSGMDHVRHAAHSTCRRSGRRSTVGTQTVARRGTGLRMVAPTPGIPSTAQSVTESPASGRVPQALQEEPLTEPEDVVRTMLRIINQSVFDGDVPAAEAGLARVLEQRLAWSSPIFDLKSAGQFFLELDKIRTFLVKPKLSVYNVRVLDDDLDAASNANAENVTVSYSWTFSGFWPIFWRPRIVLSGEAKAVVDMQKKCVMSIVDSWNITLPRLLRQIVPRLGDLYWFFAFPPAEWSTENRKLVSSAPEYRIFLEPPSEELRTFQHADDVMDTWWVYPAPVEAAFVSDVKNTQEILASAPVLVGRHGERYSWSVTIPSLVRDGLAAASALKSPDAAQVVRVGARRVAVSRPYGGLSTSEKTYEEAIKLLAALRRDKILGPAFRELGSDDAIIRSNRLCLASYNTTAGFNPSGALVAINFVRYPFQVRRNEVWVFLDDPADAQPLPMDEVRAVLTVLAKDDSKVEYAYRLDDDLMVVEEPLTEEDDREK